MFHHVRKSESFDGLAVVALVLVGAVLGLALMVRVYTQGGAREGEQCTVVCRTVVQPNRGG